VIAPKGKRIEHLWVIVSGHVSVQVDRGVGPRRVTDWRAGDVSGMLPYSRMKAPPGNNYLESRSELLAVHERHFPEMVSRCPAFTAHCVHAMLDRARSFNTSDLQDEKMVSLGRLAAGLAHELNNPASATVRGAKQLLELLVQADTASRALGAAGLPEETFAAIERVRSQCVAQPTGAVLSAVQRADREDEIAAWLERHQVDPEHAEPLAETAVTIDVLDMLAGAATGNTLDAALGWIAAGCATHSLAMDIEQAATRIHELVAAIKRFSYMDGRTGPEPIDLEPGLRDTIRVLAAKAKAKGAAITLDIEPDLPRVLATGGELNQVWLNLIDNALDAIPESGHVAVSAEAEAGRVAVRVVDDGPGIPGEVLPRIFDPFFTTKPPGQGTGLGLDIARRLLRLHHGDITVESRPGRTEFRVSLVVDRPAVTGGEPSDGTLDA
jgi:signal transduction histidine kinase